MRKQNRGPKPDALVAKAETATESWCQRRAAWRAAKDRGENPPRPQFAWPEWNNQPLNDHLIPVLKIQAENHCSFCDASPVNGVSAETIEHFHPKGDAEYEHLVLDWHNLFYACTCCQTLKRDQFHPALLKPDIDGYQFSRYFYFDLWSGEILPIAPEGTKEFAEAEVTIRLYGLNDAGRPVNRLSEWSRFRLCSDKDVAIWAYRDFLVQALEFGRA